MADWTYYKWLAGPGFTEVGGLLRWGTHAERWDPMTSSWVQAAPDRLIAATTLGDPMTIEITPAEAEKLRGQLALA